MNEMKRYLPPIMRNIYWNAFMDAIEGTIQEIQKQKIDSIKVLYSLSESDESELIDIAHTIYQLDSFMLNKLLDFLTELELYTTDDEEYARARALERLRQEIMKIPYSMSKRGTLEFYASILEFCDFNYPGVITLTKTEGDSRVLPIYTNIDLMTPQETTSTQLVVPSTSENFTGSEEIVFSTLDQLLTTPEGAVYYETLDSETGADSEDGRRAILDLSSASDLSAANLYRKVVMIGLRITETTAQYYSTGDLVGYDEQNPDYYYPGAPTFPENLGRYYLSFIDLNKRATDVLLIGPFLSLSILQSDTPNSDRYPLNTIIPDNRLAVRTISDVPEDHLGFRFRYYDVNYTKTLSESAETPQSYYEEDLYNYVYTPAADGEDATLTVFGMCQGEFCRHEVEAEADSTGQRVMFKIPKSDWSTNMAFRAYPKSDKEAFYLLYINSYGVIVQRYNNTNAQNVNLIAQVDTVSDTAYNIVYLSEASGGTVTTGLIDRVLYISQRLHSSVKSIRLMSYDSAGAETEITRLDFQENTQIELCRDITLFTYLSIRFDGQPTTYEEDPKESEEAI